MAPVQVTEANEDKVRAKLYPKKPKRPRWKLEVGQRVCITTARQPFAKRYEEDRWSRELFVLDQRRPTASVTYTLVDLAGEPIKGAFYEAELQKVKQPEDDSLFAVERVLKTRRKRNGRGVKYLVKWQGYPDKFNSWTDSLTKR